MRLSVGIAVFVASLSALTIGCSSAPTADVEAAKAAVARASESAARYAPASLREAEEAQAALAAEMKTQEAKWFKSYDRTRELAVAAKAAGEKAEADATTARTKAEAAAAARARAVAAAKAKARMTPVRVGGRIRAPIKVKDVKPVYPEIARVARAQGQVMVEATIGSTGKVEEARIIRSVPLLDEAALDAVRQWEYQPTLLNGVPVPVVVTVAIDFTRP
jgi:TonB family protein